jgi:hypothetical protein
MLSVGHLFSQVTHVSETTSGGRRKAAHTSPGRDQEPASPGIGELPRRTGMLAGEEGVLETDRNVAGASLSQLMDALSAAIVRDVRISGDRVLVALAEAAVLERELSSRAPRRWRVQQALDVLLKMGPHVTAALAAVLEHPLAGAQITCLFSD